MLSFLKFKDKLFYGWVVVVAFLVIDTTLNGLRFSFGIFFKSIESQFNLSRAATSGVFSLYEGLACLVAILAGWALDRYGPRIVILLMGLFTGFSLLLTSRTTASWQLFITYSLLLAIGTGATYVVTMSTIARWFDRKRGLALGITSSGAGLGTVAIAPFATYLISDFGWRRAYIVMGLIGWLIAMPLSRLLRKDPYEIGALPDGAESNSRGKLAPEPQNKENLILRADLSLSQVVRGSSFWLFGLIWVSYAFCTFLVLTHIVPHAMDKGISAEEAAVVFSLTGGASIVGRVVMGSISDRIGRKVTTIICSLLMGGVMIWLIWLQSLEMLYLFAIIYGFANGGLTPPITALIAGTFGMSNIGQIFGVLEVGWGIGAATGPAVGGLIFDATGTYSFAFLMAGLAMLIATLLIALIRPETNRNMSIS